MGQKVNPHGLRVGVIKDWDSRWYAEADFADNLVEDHKIRTFLKKRLYSAGVSKIEIERASDQGEGDRSHGEARRSVIGKGGAEIEKLKAEVQKMTAKKLFVDIKESQETGPGRAAGCRVHRAAAGEPCFLPPGHEVQHGPFHEGWRSWHQGRRAAGRLGGADIARTEFYSEGTIPLQTLRADIDYGFAEADTTYGKLGVKVWIYKGEVLPAKGNKEGSDK